MEKRMKNLSIQDYFNKVYSTMGIGLGITALVSFGLYSLFPELVYAIATSGRLLLLAALLIELGLVFWISKSARENKENTKLLFFVYSAVNGITLSIVFMVYQLGSIGIAFLVTAAMFAGLSFVGRTTKKDLSGMGKALIACLIGVLIVSIINIFLRLPGLSLLISYVNVFIFSGLIAYDNQKIKKIYESGNGTDGLIVFGALQLYLDFINLFLNLLRIFGKRK